jgi:membrane protease YdiL (CAAX protease family)
VVAAAPVLLGVFPRIYRSPDAHLRIDVLGHLMWIRMGIMALLVLRAWDPGPFSFWPRSREWKAGFSYYALAVLPIIGFALAVGDVQLERLHGAWWQVVGLGLGTFFGMLWVVALSEEFFFRGLIERALLNTWGSAAAAIGVSAVVYGSVHLPWNHEFPNWRHAAVVTLLGVVLGIAYSRTGGVRAPMVTHALVVTTWRLFFKSI